MVATKRCPNCGEIKDASEFGRNRSLSDGLAFYCRPCARERNRRFYRQRRRSQGLEVRDHSWVPDGFRWCPTCKQAVAHEEYTKNRRTASGFGSQCKTCHNETSSASYFFRRYRLTRQEIAEVRAAQADRCAICGDEGPQHLDHDHESGTTRQLLCQRCNQGLGLFRDDPTLLHAAALYVGGHREQQVLARLRKTFVARPATESQVTSPPVGSQRRSGRTRATERTDGSRSQGAAGEADG